MSFDFRQANVGNSDRVIRLFLGFGMILFGFSHNANESG